MQRNQDKKFGSICFTLLGVSSLIGWNAVLTSQDFFIQKFTNFNVPLLMSIPLFVTTFICNLVIYQISQIVTMNTRIIGGSFLIAVCVLILPIQAVAQPNDTGFYTTLVIVSVLGVANTVVSCSSIAYATQFPDNYIVLYFTGTGIAGFLMAFLRIIFLAIFGTDQSGIDLGTLCYFITAVFVLIISVYVYHLFFKTKYSQYFLNKAYKNSLNDNFANYMSSMISCRQDQDVSQQLILNNTIDNNDSSDQKTSATMQQKSFLSIFKKISPLPFVIYIVYVQTFMLFPAIALKSNLSGFNIAWSCTILVMMFQIGDTAGKYLAEYKVYNKTSLCILLFIRNIFFFTFIIRLEETSVTFYQQNYYAIINMILFALSNGYLTTACFSLAPDFVNDDEKEISTFIMNFPLQFGIACGSVLAISLSKI